MKKENKRIEKLCSFYVSQWHFTTMLLPYLNEQIKENVNIITILEKSIEENIKILIKKLNLKNEKEILSISWQEIISKKYMDIKQILENKIDKNKKNIILVCGNANYIQTNNANIEKWFKSSKISSLKVVNFFEVTEFNTNIMQILNDHDKIVNTSGEQEISDVFEGYKKQEDTTSPKII